MPSLKLIGRKNYTFRHHPFTDYCLIKNAIAKAICYGKINYSIVPESNDMNWGFFFNWEKSSKIKDHPLNHPRVMYDINEPLHPSQKIWKEILQTVLYFQSQALYKINHSI